MTLLQLLNSAGKRAVVAIRKLRLPPLFGRFAKFKNALGRLDLETSPICLPD
jgi:hypothetical protein